MDTVDTGDVTMEANAATEKPQTVTELPIGSAQGGEAEGKVAKVRWTSFVESTAAAFFVDYSLEKMTLEDGGGNKAKFSRMKDGSIRVEYTSSIII